MHNKAVNWLPIGRQIPSLSECVEKSNMYIFYIRKLSRFSIKQTKNRFGSAQSESNTINFDK